MIKEADHQGGWVIYLTVFHAFLEMYRNLHVATKPSRILVCESEIKLIIIIMVTLICDIAMAMSKACQCNGVVQRCALGPHDVQNSALTTEMSAPNNKNGFQ